MKISIIGLGFVGNAIFMSFSDKINELGTTKYTLNCYDKYKNDGIGSLQSCIDSNIIITALPTLFNDDLKSYDNSPTIEILNELANKCYTGMVVIKSTVEPEFTENMSRKFPSINFVHNPEFLSAKTAYFDFHNQKHIVLGKAGNCDNESLNELKLFYSELYPNAEISECSSTESECVKIFCNTFYAVKIQYFNELYSITQKIGGDYDKILEIMLKNDWINPMHTKVPGADGNLSYGGFCFPKDTNALLEFMKRKDSIHKVLGACISERNEMRDDNYNCTK